MRALARLVVFSLVVALTGCATSHLNTAAFAKPRSLALVSVTASVSGLATSTAEDQAIAGELARVTFNEIGGSRHIRLAAQKAVLASKSYRALTDKGPGFGRVLAPGYKRVEVQDDKAALQALAKELRVDGFMFVHGTYGKKTSGVGIGGIFNAPIPVTAGRARAFAHYVVHVYDANGDGLWSDQVEKISDNAITTVMGVGQYKSLLAQFTDLTKAASRELVAKLNTQVAAR